MLNAKVRKIISYLRASKYENEALKKDKISKKKFEC